MIIAVDAEEEGEDVELVSRYTRQSPSIEGNVYLLTVA